VQNVSAGGFQSHEYGKDSEAERRSKNLWNVDLYFQLTPSDQTVLQIAAGDHVYPGALSEDVAQYADKSQPKLLADVGEQLVQYLPAGKTFAKVLVINARNLIRRITDYQWVLELAAPVMPSGGEIVIAGADQNQPAIVWATANEPAITRLGFTKVSPSAAGGVEAAPPDIRAMQGSTFGGPFGKMIHYPMANTVQVVWRKN
jgi:hypothetical protein